MWQSLYYDDDEDFVSKKLDEETNLTERYYDGKNFIYRRLEDRTLNLSESVYSWKGIVICPGLIYGLGENILSFLFKVLFIL